MKASCSLPFHVLVAMLALVPAAGCSNGTSGGAGGSTGAFMTGGGPHCVSPQIACDGGCVDPRGDPANCGACGKTCGTGNVCNAGACALSCSGGTSSCAGSCVDTASDPVHCGACGTACPTSQVCSQGACGLVCLGGTTKCGAHCVDTQLDPGNCGGCGQPCATGEVCSQGACALQCNGGTTKCGAACVDTQLDLAHCGGCAQPCAAGQVCSQGACALQCGGGTILCGDACVDPHLDPAHCGGCATACAMGQVCSQGACAIECGGGTTQCGGACVDTQLDPAHCGDCATPCGAGQVCSLGACALTCGGGTTKCGAACADTNVDPVHCGSCGNACPTGQVCSGGACKATCSNTLCGAACVDLAISHGNCGACGNPCGASQVCASGACACPPGATLCGATCVNPSDNSLNCGACGSACPAGQACSAGTCLALPNGTGQTGGSLTGLSPPKVAVYAASATYGAALQASLTSTNQFTQVDTVNVSSAGSTPTVAQMLAYDAVCVFTYFSVSPTLGDNLATYFESGGGVLLFDYETQDSGNYGLKGRFETQYALSTPVAMFLNTAVTLGTVLEPANPMLAGVTTFGYAGTAPYHLPTSAFNKNSPIVVAQFSDGTPALVRGVVTNGVVTNRNLVEINGWGTSTTSPGSPLYGWDPATDGARLIAQALKYTIPASAITTAKSVSFGSQPLYTPSAPQTVTYTNNSAGPQTITALSLSGTQIGDFSASPASALPVTIPAGGTLVVNVTFAPSAVGLRAATLSAVVTGAGTATTLLTGTGT